MTALPRVSVIVTHYRQPDQLARTLNALARQDYPAAALEIIVTDDGSPEPPVVPAGVRLVRQRDDGFRAAAARNLGARAATGDVLVFLDADTTPERGFIGALTRPPAGAFDTVAVGRRRHADLAGVAPDLAIETAVRGRELPEPRWLADGYAATNGLCDADDRSYRYVISAVLACSRRFFDEVGGFDESFTSYGGEDWEWAYRAWIRGAALAHVPEAVAWHDGPSAEGRAIDRAAKNAEALRLSQLVPVPGSRGRSIHSSKVDVLVLPPRDASPAAVFVSCDSVLAALPGAEAFDPADDSARLDRVRLEVQIVQPVRVTDAGALAAAAARAGRGEVIVIDAAGRDLVRVTSTRMRRRRDRWGPAAGFATERVTVAGIVPIDDDVDLEAYLGGW